MFVGIKHKFQMLFLYIFICDWLQHILVSNFTIILEFLNEMIFIKKKIVFKWGLNNCSVMKCSKSANIPYTVPPSTFNLDQKFHGLSCFWGIDIHKTVQNQSRKTSVIRLPKFTTVNMARKWHQRPSFSIDNLFFEDYFFGSLMTDIFLDWFLTFLFIWNPISKKCHGTFGLGWKY